MSQPAQTWPFLGDIGPKRTPAAWTGALEVGEWRHYLASSNMPRAVLRKRASLPLAAISRMMAA